MTATTVIPTSRTRLTVTTTFVDSSSSFTSNEVNSGTRVADEHAAEEQLVDDVRGLVADPVGVGERGLPDHVAEHGDAGQPADRGTARSRTRRRDSTGAASSRVTGGSGWGSAVGSPARPASSIAMRSASSSLTRPSTSSPSTSVSPDPTLTSTVRARSSSKRASSRRNRSRLRSARVDETVGRCELRLQGLDRLRLRRGRDIGAEPAAEVGELGLRRHRVDLADRVADLVTAAGDAPRLVDAVVEPSRHQLEALAQRTGCHRRDDVVEAALGLLGLHAVGAPRLAEARRGRPAPTTHPAARRPARDHPRRATPTPAAAATGSPTRMPAAVPAPARRMPSGDMIASATRLREEPVAERAAAPSSEVAR